MEENVPPGSICCFCRTTYDDEALYGKFYKIEEITTHYFCLLLSSKVQQRGSDNQGILGFLSGDIRNEIRRGKNVTCTYCGKRGATISCHYSKCKIHFHLPCGRTRDTFHQFFGEFKSFCCRHRKSQKIKQTVLQAMSDKQSICSICLESVPATPSPGTLWAPCCSKDAWFHRLCIQRLALSAGYFFKCPLCNNTAQFVESMRSCGIWIPEQDASWERDPERYEGLLQRHNSCDAKSCRCRQGRTFHLENTKWEIKLCGDCGSQGMHVHCGNLRVTQDWVCSVCSNVIASKGELQKSGKISRVHDALMARNRVRRSLPIRHPRVTRQHQTPEEEEGGEGEDVNEEESIRKKEEKRRKVEDAGPRTDKGTSSVPQKGVFPQFTDATAQVRDTRHGNQPPTPPNENSDVEILENSDDDIQILSTPNVRFIKTNSGLSVPVVKLHATQPLGEELVASGEPCQTTSCLDKGAHVDNDKKNVQLLDVCQPSTSQSLAADSGVVGNETLKSCSSDDDDDIIVEFEQSPQTFGVKQIYQSSDQTDITVESVIKNTKVLSVPDKNTPKSFTSDGIVEQLSDDECLPLNVMPLTQSTTTSGPAALNTEMEVDLTGPSAAQLRRQSLLEDSVTKDTQEFTASPGNFSDTFYDLSKAIHSASLATSLGLQQSGLSMLQSGTFIPAVSAIQSMAHLTPNMTTSTSANIASSGFSESIQADPDMSAWRSKIMNQARAHPNPAHLAVVSGTIPNVLDPDYVQPSQVPLSEGSTIQASAKNCTIGPYIPRVPGTNTSSIHSNSLLKENSNQIQNSGYYMLQNQTMQDDWSVELVPTDQMTTTSLSTHQSGAEEHPDVVFERYSGPIPRDTLLWEQHEEPSEQSTDDIIVIDDDPSAARRERKQKLLERRDYKQCVSASNPHSVGEPRRMSHLPAIANGVTRSTIPGFTLTDPTSSVAAMTGPSNIYILVNPLLPPSRILRTSSQDFCQP